jgi:hypothetical protein
MMADCPASSAGCTGLRKHSTGKRTLGIHNSWLLRFPGGKSGPAAIIATIAALTSATPVCAEGPAGIAFVQAVEQSHGVCTGETPEKAFACAMKQCIENGTLAEDCIPMKWCMPAGWSADIFKQHKEGPHWHDYLCGWDSESDLDAAIKVACEGSSVEYLIECTAVAKWRPDGSVMELMQ